jgi:ferric-dicitrate binding protein FerR (iron transport regulator)
MAMSCSQAGRLSVASAGGHASAAERLELEAHLATCVRCSAEHAITLSTTRALREVEAPTLSPVARQRVWRAALSQRAHAPTVARRFGWPLAAGTALAMAAVAAIWLGGREPAEYAIVGGEVIVVPEPAAATAGPTSAAVTLRSGAASGGQVRLADAAGALAPATEIVWQRARRVVELRAGSLTVDIEHREGQHFEVRTPRFTVEVVGTKFTVDMQGVRTER